MQAILRRQSGFIFAGASALVLLWPLGRHCLAHDGREQVNIELGLWSTRFLIGALAITPLSAWLREPSLKRWRRPLGLAALAFALVHASQYAVYSMIWPDRLHYLFRRPYLIIGFVAVLLLIPLALTSSNAAVRWLGPRRWKALHKLVYPAAALVVAHALLGFGNPLKEPGLQAALIAGLLALRIKTPWRKAAQKEVGGLGRNRTGVHGFAVRCVTTPPPGHPV